MADEKDQQILILILACSCRPIILSNAIVSYTARKQKRRHSANFAADFCFSAKDSRFSGTKIAKIAPIVTMWTFRVLYNTTCEFARNSDVQ